MFKGSRRIFLWAIGLSLLVHFLFALYFHYVNATQGPVEPIVARIQLTRIATAPPSTPPPTPPPRAPVVKPSIIPPRATSNKGKPAQHVLAAPTLGPTLVPATPTPKPTPSPKSSASPGGACGSQQHNGDPVLSQTPGPPDIPPEARASKVTGTAVIKVSLDPSGKVTATTVAQSSGNDGLDRVAQQMANDSVYEPKVENCKDVAGVYMFAVRFNAL